MWSDNMDNIGQWETDDEKQYYESIRTTEQKKEKIREMYLQLSRKKNLDVNEIYHSVDEFFDDTTGQYRKAYEMKKFEVHVEPLRDLCWHKTVKQNLLKFYASAIYRYISEDFDYIATFNALEGRGKSATSIYLALELQKLGMNFNIDEDIFFRGDADPVGFAKIYRTISRREKGI